MSHTRHVVAVVAIITGAVAYAATDYITGETVYAAFEKGAMP